MMKYNTLTLSNGLRVIHLPSSSPVVYCGYQIAAGSRHEAPGEEGLAHFCEHMTFKGTRKRNALQIINALERVGGELNAFTNKEDTTFYAAIHRDHFRLAVELLTDIVFNSQYPQVEIDKEVEVICDEIESYNDSPAELIYDEFENLLFEGHPLGHNILGEEDQLRSFTTEDALRFTRRYYRPDNAVFFVFGDVNLSSNNLSPNNLSPCPSPKGRGDRNSAIVNILKKAGSENFVAVDSLDKLPSTAEISGDEVTISPPLWGGAGGEVVGGENPILRHKDTHQAHVMMGCRAYHFNHPRRMALFLLNNLLGGPGMNSRLNLSLRERHGLVYTVESSMVSYSDTGLWAVYFGCDPKDVSKCRRLVRQQLDRLMDKPLSTAQLKAAKQQIKGQIAIGCDNREQFALDFGKSFLHHGTEKDVDVLFKKIDAVTAADIQQVARELFDAKGMLTLIYT